MKKIFTLFFLFACSQSRSQNIIINPDFESFSSCPVANGELQKANNWLDAVYSCDYMNCAFQGWSPQAVAGAQNGLGYAGFATYGNANGAAESFGQFLLTPILAGHSYRMDFFAKRSNSGFYSNVCTGVCFYGFSGNPVAGGTQTNICTDALPGAVLLGCSDTVIDVNWQPYSVSFTAPSTCDFIVITPGCALNCAEYIYIDNINFVQTVNFANVCLGDTTIFSMSDTASMVSASWTFSDPLSGINNSSSLFNPTHVFTSTGIFLVRVIRTYVNTSVDTVIIPVTIYPHVSVSLGNDTTICQGQSLLLNAAGPGITAYQWQDGTTASTYLATLPGIYSVAVSNPGCNAADTMNLNVISCTAVTALFQTAQPFICPGTCTDFTNFSTNATSYLWSFPGASPSVSTDINPAGICYNSPGSYDVELIASDGTNSDTLVLSNCITVYPQPPPQGIQQVGDSLIANQGSVSYQWYFNGTLIPGATNYFWIALQSGDYNVVCTDGNNCEVEAVIFDVIAEIQSADDSQQMAVFPNPAENELTLSFSEAVRVTGFSIHNLIGQNIIAASTETENSFGARLTAGDDQLQDIDVRQLVPGMYFLEVETSREKYHVRFLKK